MYRILSRILRLQRPPRTLVIALVAVGAAVEVGTSWTQANVLAAVSSRLTYSVEPGASRSIRFPGDGPYDRRLGYAMQPAFVERLRERGFSLDAQARWSPGLRNVVDAGFGPIYPVKTRAGLSIVDRDSRPLFSAGDPRTWYGGLADIPPLVVDSLLFIENRELLRQEQPFRNPAVEYDRLARAMFDVMVNRLFPNHPVSGGSTLAIQLEKLRHSRDGRTSSVEDKARQIVSASLRSYLGGPNTVETRKRLATDYLNSLPLSATAAHGEVFGLGDGLLAWYGADVRTVDALLAAREWNDEPDPQVRAQVATAYRQVLSLLVAVKKPSTYLQRDRDALDRRTDAYLLALASAGVIPAWLRDAALRVRVTPDGRRDSGGHGRFVPRKAADFVRHGLVAHLGLAGVHELDRLDLTVRTTLDARVTDAVTRELERVGTCAGAADAGLIGRRLLDGRDCGRVIYSFTLYERTLAGNVLRVQADTYEQPLNVNEGTRLELGSTAKLRTLVTYLEVIEALHQQYAHLPLPAIEAVEVPPRDRLTRWALDHLGAAGDRSLEAMLDAAMSRAYDASPYESFFTGGGLHWFQNFDNKDDDRILTVREAFQRSVNLVFIRLMRDVVDHFAPGGSDAAEREAFSKIHASWRSHGYPFQSLVPSYATAIGSSGDNPAALAELMGIVVNGGIRRSAFGFDRLEFAVGTPYETHLRRRPTQGTRVLSRTVAMFLERELVSVVEHGTGRRLAGGVTMDCGRTLRIGGKTGTGDNRFETRHASRVVNRTAAFTFVIGGRFYGSMLAYVPGEAAAEYGFTSALPVQIVKQLLPVLGPVLDAAPAHGPHGTAVP